MREAPPRYAIYEASPEMNAEPDKVIMGPYSTITEAIADRVKYGFTSGNYYVDLYAPKGI
jgi:hypothetical protein